MWRRTLLIALLCAPTALAQLLPDKTGALPAGVILIPGAVPSASDRLTPVPEDGSVAEHTYRNRYFGMAWPLPDGWSEQVKGPPPSDRGTYVLAQLAAQGHGTILVSAQDLFFNVTPAGNALEMVKYSREHLQPYYEVERPPADVTIGERHYARFDYHSPVAGIHWYILATEVRCHLVEFVYTGREPKELETFVHDLERTKLGDDAGAPQCIADYATGDNVISRAEPVPYEKKYNPIPVRLIIGTNGKVRHVHVLSAFPDQARSITDALLQWRFKPQDHEVETGLMLGGGGRERNEPRTARAEGSQ